MINMGFFYIFCKRLFLQCGTVTCVFLSFTVDTDCVLLEFLVPGVGHDSVGLCRFGRQQILILSLENRQPKEPS